MCFIEEKKMEIILAIICIIILSTISGKLDEMKELSKKLSDSLKNIEERLSIEKNINK